MTFHTVDTVELGAIVAAMYCAAYGLVKVVEDYRKGK
jgi:hypothetical protein